MAGECPVHYVVQVEAGQDAHVIPVNSSLSFSPPKYTHRKIKWNKYHRIIELFIYTISQNHKVSLD